MFTLCSLYVAQGIPWGFVTVTFASWLARPEHGITTEQLGPILAVATLPWSFKFFWGPIMDRFSIPSWGRRRPWIIFAQSMAILILGSMLLFDDLPGMVWTSQPGDPFRAVVYRVVPGPLAGIILVANIFVSMQDVAVDALAVDLLREEERGVANGMMYGCSYLGTAIGGAGLGMVVSHYGIQAGLAGQALLLFVIMLVPLLTRERRLAESSVVQSSAIPEESHNPGPYDPPRADFSAAEPSVASPPGSVVRNCLRAFGLRSTLLGVFVAVGVKIGIGVLTAVLVDFLMKDGGWSQSDYTSITGGWAVLLGLGGAVLGGVLADRVGAKPVIFCVSMFLGVLWIGAGAIPGAIHSRSTMMCMLIAQEFLFAVLSVGLFSLFMTISWPRVAATQFTAYMALMNLSTTIGSYTAGTLSGEMSVSQILVVAGLLQLVMVLPVLMIDPRQTRQVLGDS